MVEMTLVMLKFYVRTVMNTQILMVKRVKVRCLRAAGALSSAAGLAGQPA
jgi:hypothetical protein